MKGRRGGEDSLIPEAATDALKRTLANTENVRAQLNQFLEISDADVLAEMPPLARAQSLLVLAKTASTLVALRLRCSGVCPDDHPVQTELERLSLYQEKLDGCIGLSKEPLRPSATLNYQAATRFIEHSLPDLTAEQKQNMRDISRGDTIKSGFLERYNAQKRQKYQANEKVKQSVQAAADEFLQQVAREIFVSNRINVKGPLQIETADGDDEQME